MAIDPQALPEHPDDLRAYCLRLLTELDEKTQHLEKLRHELELFKRTLYGRRSEKLDPGQLMLEFATWIKARTAEAAALAASAESSAETLAPTSTPPAPARPASDRPGHGRQRLPRLLPRQRVVHELPAAQCHCRACGHTLVVIGEETSEQLDYKPASLFVIEHVRVKYACQACAEHVALAGMPAQPIDKGLPGPGLMAQVVVAKFADHLPLHRQEQIFARHGVAIARQSMCDWVAAAAALLEPIYRDLTAHVLAGKVVHTDDSPVPVQDRTRTKTREGRLWVYVGNTTPAAIVYDYTPNRTREGPVRFLGDYRGYLQADAYAGYDVLYASGHVVEVGCWAHARRYFFEAKDTDAGRALPVLAMIQELYRVEAEGQGLRAEGRRALRQAKAQPILERLKGRLDGDADVVLPRSPMGKAVGYARGQWAALTRYLADGDLAIDNNVSERALRRVVLGRSNWLFCGSDAGGQRAAILYSLVATCKEHRLDPWAYLTDVLGRISTHPNGRRAELLPQNWKAATPAES
jgi:transposase